MHHDESPINVVGPGGSLTVITFDQFMVKYPHDMTLVSFKVPSSPKAAAKLHPAIAYEQQKDEFVISFAVPDYAEWIPAVVEVIDESFVYAKEQRKIIAQLTAQEQRTKFLEKSIVRLNYLWGGILTLVVVAHMVLGYIQHAR